MSPPDSRPDAETASPAALAEASAFLARVAFIDGHNDMPYVIWSNAAARGDVRLWDARRLHPETDTDIPRLRAGLVGTQINTAFIPTMTPDPLRVRLEVIDVMLQLEQLYPDVFHPVLKPADVAAAKQAGRIGQLKAVEGLVGVDRIGHLRLFHAMGIRLVTLCHNESLPFIDSATDRPGPTPLSRFGAEIVAEMERLGLLIDLAHVSPAAQHAVMDVAKGSVIISHANARALCAHPRNAPDDVIRRIAEGGGLVMPTFVPSFLQQGVYEKLLPMMDAYGKAREGIDRARYEETRKAAFALFERDGIELLIDHIEHMRDVAGIEGLGIGSDFYGGHNPPGLEDAACFPALFAGLMRRGWKTGDLEKLAGENFLRVWKAVYREAPAMQA